MLRKLSFDGLHTLQQRAYSLVRCAAGLAGKIIQIDPDFTGADIVCFALIVFSAAVLGQHVIRIAVALIRAPGVDAGMILISLLASVQHRSAEGLTVQHPIVEDPRKGFGGGIIHCPAGSDDSPHTHANQLGGQIGGQTMAVTPGWIV